MSVNLVSWSYFYVYFENIKQWCACIFLISSALAYFAYFHLYSTFIKNSVQFGQKHFLIYNRIVLPNEFSLITSVILRRIWIYFIYILPLNPKFYSLWFEKKYCLVTLLGFMVRYNRYVIISLSLSRQIETYVEQ